MVLCRVVVCLGVLSLGTAIVNATVDWPPLSKWLEQSIFDDCINIIFTKFFLLLVLGTWYQYLHEPIFLLFVWMMKYIVGKAHPKSS